MVKSQNKGPNTDAELSDGHLPPVKARKSQSLDQKTKAILNLISWRFGAQVNINITGKSIPLENELRKYLYQKSNSPNYSPNQLILN
jgi:hypothetical protein